MISYDGFFLGSENIKTVNSGMKSQSIKTLNCVLIMESIAFYTFLLLFSIQRIPNTKEIYF